MTFDDGNNDGLRSEINVTPLVDVMLVLLVIFMVVTPLIHQELRIELPVSKASQDVTEPRQVHLTAAADGTLLLNDTPVARDELESALRALYAARDDSTIFLQADRGLPYATVVDLMDTCRLVGIQRIGVLTQAIEKK